MAGLKENKKKKLQNFIIILLTTNAEQLCAGLSCSFEIMHECERKEKGKTWKSLIIGNESNQNRMDLSCATQIVKQKNLLFHNVYSARWQSKEARRKTDGSPNQLQIRRRKLKQN